MKSQPNPDCVRDDVIYTPVELARKIYRHFRPTGFGLDPSMGNGAFYNLFDDGKRDWCEIANGRDFFSYDKKVDFIMTNPPWSLFRRFVEHGMEIANDIYYLITVNHVFTKCRIRSIYQAGFGIREILMIDTPKNFPQSGFQVGVVHLKKGWKGDIKLSAIGDTFVSMNQRQDSLI